MLNYAGLQKPFWAESVTCAADVRNRFFCPGREDVTSYELFIGHKPRLDHIRTFGCHAWVFVPKEKRRKLDEKSEEGIIISSLENSLYKVWLQENQVVVYSRDVKIDDSKFPRRE